MCQSCSNFDPAFCAKFYSIWCTVVGAICTLVGLIDGIGHIHLFGGVVRGAIGLVFGIVAITYLLAGIFMIIGWKMASYYIYIYNAFYYLIIYS